MYDYQAPLADMKRLLNEAATDATHQENNTNTAEEFGLLLDQAAHFMQSELVPANAPGDAQGCQFDAGQVCLPDATDKAFKRYINAGWMGMNLPEAYGGQALPATVSAKIAEMTTSSNHAISMLSALTMSATKAILAVGNDDQKNTYLPQFASGAWSGTMCMTEAHCGSDLGLIKTAAKPQAAGHYLISGNKIFISGGEHQSTDNIIHLVLARIDGAVAGVRGLSLFLVPKYLPETGAANTISCIGIEHKMGIHANPTCSMSFESAQGYLLGQANEGLSAMFVMMNEMRLGTALQGVGMSEQAFQKSYHYALERRQGKALNPQQRSGEAADSLLVHADIRRMLLTQKAFAEGGRAFCHHCAELIDRSAMLDKPEVAPNADALAAEKMLGLLTPIAKAFLTETGLESASLAMQIYGGHGYIRETGVEQIYRDGRIATLYEGTTGIQALDLLGRKVLGDQATILLQFTREIHRLSRHIIEDCSENLLLLNLAKTMQGYAKEWPQFAQIVGMKALQDHEEVGAAALDFLMYSGYVTLAFFWLKMATRETAQEASRLTGEHTQSPSKLDIAEFYFARLLPRSQAHREAALAGKLSLRSLSHSEVSL